MHRDRPPARRGREPAESAPAFPLAQPIGTFGGVAVAAFAGFTFYGVPKGTVGIRLDEEAEFDGADLAIHRISATSRL